MTTATNTAYGAKLKAVRLGSSCIIALAILFGGLGVSSSAKATPLIGNVDIASHLDRVDARLDLFLEVGGFKRSSKFRSHRGRGFHGHRFKGFKSFHGRHFNSFHGFRGHRNNFHGFRRHRFSWFH